VYIVYVDYMVENVSYMVSECSIICYFKIKNLKKTSPHLTSRRLRARLVKYSAQNSPKVAILRSKIGKNLWRGKSPSPQTSSPMGRGYPSPHSTPSAPATPRSSRLYCARPRRLLRLVLGPSRS